MRTANRTGAMVGCLLLFTGTCVQAQDWPQWRGTNRDAKVMGFKAPKDWPKELTEKWKVKVGDGVSTPVLVGDKLYVFTREGNNEVLRCLDAGTGKEKWAEKYDSGAFSGRGDNGFQGPRSSPTVADGKLLTIGVNGVLTCCEADTGKKVWANTDYKGSFPQFHTSSSPIVVDGLCIAQLGGETGGVLAYELATGKEKWKWTGDGTAYASPSLLGVDGTKAVVVESAKNVVALGVADGQVLWKVGNVGLGRLDYNAASPMVDGQTIFYGGTGRPIKAVRMEKKGDALTAKELWSNNDNPVKFNTPVLKDGLLYGISTATKLFCINTKDGKTAWSTTLGGGGGRSGGYGSVVDAGPVLFALTPNAQLVVFEPSDKEFKQVAKYKVGADLTYAYPIISGNRVFVKDKDSVYMYTIE